ncbi:MAG TPA: Fur family transcriptional regulator [Candidatus Acidoferrales bacterium]|nr:Fur family transcriptional regulator [Candidatus Acidoferrales bacterium]
MQKPHDCKTELKEANLKVTTARLGVLQVLERSAKPIDIATVSQYLDRKQIKADQATIFRIMHAFADKGLVVPIQFNEGKFRYEYGPKADHHHFICDNCGTIEDISDCRIEKLEKEIRSKKKLLIKRHSLEFYGLCQNCQK